VVGDVVPDALVWVEPGTEPAQLRDVLAGDGMALLCFTPHDWSPT